MRKMTLLATVVAMVLALAAPAFAQNFQYQFQSQDADSGNVAVEGSTSNVIGTDINVAQGDAVVNQVNTGNQQTQQAIQQGQSAPGRERVRLPDLPPTGGISMPILPAAGAMLLGLGVLAAYAAVRRR